MRHNAPDKCVMHMGDITVALDNIVSSMEEASENKANT